MKHLLTQLFLVGIVGFVTAQNNPGQFEIRAVDGPMCNEITIQMRAINEILPFHNGDCDLTGNNTILLDLTYSLMWTDATITNLTDDLRANCGAGGDGYHNVDVGQVVTMGATKLKGFASGGFTPFDFPEAWPLNEWIDITVVNLVGLSCLDGGGSDEEQQLSTLVEVVPHGQFGQQYYPNIGMDITGDDGGFDFTPEVVDAPLPLNLLSFYAKKDGERNSLLTWSTTDEVNTSHFIVQRSIDRSNWSEVGKVQAAGSSAQLQNYSLADRNVYDGRKPIARYYYRLLMVDLDGRSKASNIQVVLFENDPSVTKILTYPNPATDGVSVEFNYGDDDAALASDILLYNDLGQLVYRQEVPENAIVQFVDFRYSDINSGAYTLQVMDANEVILATEKIVVQR